MKSILLCTITGLMVLSGLFATAQEEIQNASPKNQLYVFWRQCSSGFISDEDSATAHRYFDAVVNIADKQGNRQLKAYALYFRKAWRILFSIEYEQHFTKGGYTRAVALLCDTRDWAMSENYPDIAAACEHNMGLVYVRANRYGLAFEHLLRADNAFRKMGYANVPNASFYLYNLGLYFYQFEEFDKALQLFLEATRFNFHLPRVELNTLNAIGLIYARQDESREAASFFRSTMARARQYNDDAWVGIAAGNLGNIFLKENTIDSSFFYHRMSFDINSRVQSDAREDAAKSALSLATLYIRKNRPDSASHFIEAGKRLAKQHISDTTDVLDYRGRLLRVMIEKLKHEGNFRGALLLTDTLYLVEQQLRSKRDNKILSRAIEKTEAVSYNARLSLLKSQKDLAQARLYFTIAALTLLFILIAFIFRDKWLRKQRQIQLVEKDRQILLSEKLRAEEGLKHAQELLTAYVDMVKEKATLINHLESELTILKKVTPDAPELHTISSNREKLLASTILTDTDWQQFRNVFEQVYPGFSYRLKVNYPELSPAEARLLYLIKLDLTTREMAAMLGISVYTIHKLRYRLRKKLNMEEEKGLDAVIRKVN